MIGEGDRGEEAEEEFAAQVFAVEGADDGILQFFVADEDVVFDGERADSGDDVEGIDDVDAHDAGEDAEEVGEGDVRGEPVEGGDDERIHQHGVHGAEDRPDEREQRADDPLVVPPAAVVVPQLDLEPEYEDLPATTRGAGGFGSAGL